MQNKVRNFIQDHKLDCPLESRYLDLMSELGELGKEILLATNYGKTNFSPSKNLSSEMGDCLFSLLALCDSLGLDAEAALEGALAKYRARFIQKGNVGSGE